MVQSIRPIPSTLCTPMFEALEGRRLLSGGTEHPVLEGLHDGVLTIRGSDANDVIKLSTDDTHLRIFKNSASTECAAADVKQVIVYGGGGDDDLEVDTSHGPFTMGVVLIGGAGNDTLVGGGGRDYLLGNDGNDNLSGSGDADTLSGGGGADNMAGGDGADRVDGDDGNDRIAGGGGSDNLHGEAGSDRLDGGAGNDKLDGGPGVDRLDGGKGTNHCNGGTGKDRIIYRPGNDILAHSDAKNERINGSATGDDQGSDKPTDVNTKPGSEHHEPDRK